jgi:hypothetical protein
VRARWLSRRALLLHLLLVFIVSACLLAAWWQLHRALDGNGLSWFYTFEWPVLAILSIYGWWHLITEDPEVRRARMEASPVWDEVDETT